MIKTFVGKTALVEWSIYIDAAVQVRPGLPTVGNNKMRLRMAVGLVDLGPFLECDDPLAHSVKAALGGFERPDALPVHIFLLALEKLGRKGFLDRQADSAPRRVHVGLGHPVVADDGPM